MFRCVSFRFFSFLFVCCFREFCIKRNETTKLFFFYFLFLLLFFFVCFLLSVATDCAISHADVGADLLRCMLLSVATDCAISLAVGLVDALNYEFKGVGFAFGVSFHPILEIGLHVSRDSLDTILQFGFSLGVSTPIDALGVLVLAVVAEVVNFGDL